MHNLRSISGTSERETTALRNCSGKGSTLRCDTINNYHVHIWLHVQLGLGRGRWSISTDFLQGILSVLKCSRSSKFHRCWPIRHLYGFKKRKNGLICDMDLTTCNFDASTRQCLLCAVTLPWLSIQTTMTWILATPIISLAHLMACVLQGRSYGKFTVFYLFINILCLFQELEFKSHGLAVLAIKANRLAEACSHGSKL